jgi:hypothetical protein
MTNIEAGYSLKRPRLPAGRVMSWFVILTKAITMPKVFYYVRQTINEDGGYMLFVITPVIILLSKRPILFLIGERHR